jgi:hypothetical protein
MVATIRPVRYVRPAETGRTEPLFIVCEDSDGVEVEIIAKFSVGCTMVGLAMELIAAQLGRDLALPVPKPYLIEVDPEWVSAIPEAEHREVVVASSPTAFGSTFVSGGFAAWPPGRTATRAMLPTALAIFCFDCFISNPDRRDEKPNCLVLGDELRIIDHELACRVRGVLGWMEPWRAGSLRSFEVPGAHIFRQSLQGKPHDYEPIQQRWMGLSDDRLRGYEASIPAHWGDANAAVDDAIGLIRGVRDHITDCLREVGRVLR